MSMNDEMMILSSGFTGYIKRNLGISTHECQQGKLVSISPTESGDSPLVAGAGAGTVHPVILLV